MVDIVEVREDWQAKATETLAWEFVAWLEGRYPDMRDVIETYMTAQNFAERMADVRVDYNPPGGEALLALIEGEPAGILMMRDLGGGVCEMNRMFVRESARGHGVGRKLADRLTDIARAAGFDRMRLGALPRHTEALALYRSLGFVDDSSGAQDGSPSQSVRLTLQLKAPHRHKTENH